MTRTLSIATITHGRVLVRDAPGSGILVVGFHGYAQRAEDLLDQLAGMPDADAWTLVSVQGLHRFYGRVPGGARGEERVVSSWMTREDRDTAVADNVAYVDHVVDELDPEGRARLVLVGFSQGASMAWRAALLGRRPTLAVAAVGGDLPPELRSGTPGRPWPRVLLVAGQGDTWYTSAKLDADHLALTAQGVAPEILRHAGGHEWTEDVRKGVGTWISDRVQGGP
jgi:predicted esterase